MTHFSIPVAPFVSADFQRLAALGLIEPFREPDPIATDPWIDTALPVHATAPDAPIGYQLLCVRKASVNVHLTCHNEREDVLFWHPRAARFAQTVLVLALMPVDEFCARSREERLVATDFAAFRIPYNHPELSAFTIPPHTAHTEVCLPETGTEAPVFFVAEPVAMTTVGLDHPPCTLSL